MILLTIIEIIPNPQVLIIFTATDDTTTPSDGDTTTPDSGDTTTSCPSKI